METNYTNVYTALTRLQKKGVAKVGENWGLDEWYPPAPLSAKAKAATAAGGDLAREEEDEREAASDDTQSETPNGEK